MSRHLNASPAPTLRRSSTAVSLTPSVRSARSLDRRFSALSTAEQGHDVAAVTEDEQLQEDIDEIKRYEVRPFGSPSWARSGADIWPS